ncbi:uncharacterized protein LOC117892165 [Drosophila subobscura]|uniref:uncharacterized protein LOC117892165 n=1 Tax=Drosophila subobscura TaxID=7241 RepID=UPI00155A73C5|nr:uncharacterized protein LOC117892165 [Drosophila subobscura]
MRQGRERFESGSCTEMFREEKIVGAKSELQPYCELENMRFTFRCFTVEVATKGRADIHTYKRRRLKDDAVPQGEPEAKFVKLGFANSSTQTEDALINHTARVENESLRERIRLMQKEMDSASIGFSCAY